MKRNRILAMVLLSTLVLFLLACGLVEQPTAPKVPSTSIYATALSVGGTHVCALLNNGTVACWGSNSSGELGDGTYTKQLTAAIVPGLNDIIAVSAGGGHTCVLTIEGKVKCWGDNTSGQLGDGSKIPSASPVDVVGLTEEVTGIAASSDHTCAVLKSGKVMCWGKGLYGRLGNADAERINPSPLIVTNLDENVNLVSSKNEHTCALTVSGKVKCWGHNADGELGNGDDANIHKTPVDVSNLGSGNIQIATGFANSCALTSMGNVECWGWIGMQQFTNVPVLLDTFAGNNVGIASGGSHICVITERGVVKCNGENEKGQLGNGSTRSSYKAVQVKGLSSSVSSIDAVFDTTCALTTDGEIWCWGDNTVGQLGNGTTENSATPVKVTGIVQ